MLSVRKYWLRLFTALMILGVVSSPLAAVESTVRCEKEYRKIIAAEEKVRREVELRQQGKWPRPVSTSEEHLLTDLHERVWPWYNDSNHHGYFEGAGGAQIFYRRFVLPPSKEKGAVVISHGFAESSSKWAEMAFNLNENGYSVYIFDHRGHGRSEKLAENPRMVHVDRFSNYVGDLDTFIEKVVKSDDFAGRKKHLLGFSMGGAIATLYDSRNPETFDKVVLGAPMLKIRFSVFPHWLASAVLKVGRMFRNEKHYALGVSDSFAAEPAFKNNIMTGSRTRFLAKRLRFNLDDTVPQGGPSFGWLAEAMWGAREARQSGARIDKPVLLIQGGSDKVVSKSAQNQFCNGAPNCSKLVLESARHDIFWEKDAIRDHMLRSMFYFLEND